MSNMFNALGNRVKGSAIVVPVFIVFVGLFIVANILGIRDYVTSYRGIALLPLTPMPFYPALFDGAVSLLPQLLQVALAYTVFTMVAEDERTQWLRISFVGVLIAMMAVDVGTGTAYNYEPGSGTGGMITAVAWSFVIDTLGSEFLWTFSFGMLIELAKPALEKLAAFVEVVWDFTAPLRRRLIPNSRTGRGGDPPRMNHNVRKEAPAVPMFEERPKYDSQQKRKRGRQ